VTFSANSSGEEERKFWMRMEDEWKMRMEDEVGWIQPQNLIYPEADLGTFSMFSRTGAPTKMGPPHEDQKISCLVLFVET